MSSISKFTTYDTWTVSELIDASSSSPRGNKKVSIPEFQRRLVWTRKKQEGLIDSIKRGFPFGSLLMYKSADEPDHTDNYKLIDGLQRTQTLKQYTSHPNRTFSSADLSDDLINIVAEELNPLSDLDSLANSSKKSIQRFILEWVWDSRGFSEDTGWGLNAITEMLLHEMLDLEEDTYEFYRARKDLLAVGSAYRQQLEPFLDAVQLGSDIGNVEVPVIVFNGPSSELATVFVLLNTQGIKLSRYEIYAAQWLEYRFPIENTEIIEAIWNKYRALEDEGFLLDISATAPDAKSRIERKYTLFEYLFGLGQCLTRKYSHFFKSVKVDEPSSVAFNLMSACIGEGVAEKHVRELPAEIRGLNLRTLEKCLVESVDFVYQLFQPILSPERYDGKKTPYFHADLQIISMIASAFRVRYNRNDLSEIDGWTARRDKLNKHLPMYYLYDVLRENWKGSGDSRLAEVVNKNAYLTSPPSETIWSQVLNVWFRNHVNERHHAKQYIKDDLPEYLLLRYTYMRYLNEASKYYVQHLVPISRLISPPSYYYDFFGPINTIGNLALLPETVFTDMGDLTYVEYLHRQRSKGALGLGQLHDELRKYEELMLCDAEILPSELTKSAFESFLDQRFERLKSKFFEIWRDHIPE